MGVDEEEARVGVDEEEAHQRHWRAVVNEVTSK